MVPHMPGDGQKPRSAREPLLWPALKLPDALVRDLLRDNPWWQGQPSKQLPPHQRDLVGSIHRRLQQRLAPIVVVRGPRQVGKTTAQLQVVADLLAAGVRPDHILRVQCDELPALEDLTEPVLRIVDWFEGAVLRTTLNAAAAAGEPTYLFLDEVQNLSDWPIQLKHLVDSSTTQIVVTGSSALRIEAGRDSLAGRITTYDLGPLLLREIAELACGGHARSHWEDNGAERVADPAFWTEGVAKAQKERDLRLRAFGAFSARGGYPIAHERSDAQWQEIATYLNETIIKRAIQHDLRLGPRGAKRDEKLLEEVFRLCCRYAGQVAGQSAFVPEIQQALAGNIGWGRILTYMKFLDGTLLVRLVPAMELRLKKRKSPAKICISDHGLRASWLQEIIPLDSAGLNANPHLTDLAGHLAESALGYFLSSVPKCGTGALSAAWRGAGGGFRAHGRDEAHPGRGQVPQADRPARRYAWSTRFPRKSRLQRPLRTVGDA